MQMLMLREFDEYVMDRLTTEAVESTALPLECVDDVERGDGLALRVLSVCDCIADDAFEEGLEDTTCLFVDHWLNCYLLLEFWVEGSEAYWLRYA